MPAEVAISCNRKEEKRQKELEDRSVTGKKTSARMVLIKILCIFLVPFLLFLILLNVYCNTVYTQRLTQNNQTRLAMYESFIEEDLAHVQYFMSDMIANDVNFASIRYPLSDVNSYL